MLDGWNQALSQRQLGSRGCMPGGSPLAPGSWFRCLGQQQSAGLSRCGFMFVISVCSSVVGLQTCRPVDEGKILLQNFFVVLKLELGSWNGSQTSSTMDVKSLNPWHWPASRLSDITNQCHYFGNKRHLTSCEWWERACGQPVALTAMIQHGPPPATPGLLTERATLLQECEDEIFV